MDRKDAERVWELLTRHYKYTGSSRARAILDDWAGFLPKFVKVMPVEYARALQELEAAQKTSDGMTIGVKRSA
jgi:glutamate synthase (NADPH/NADH) large chain